MLTARKARLEALAAAREPNALAVVALRECPERFLATDGGERAA